MMNRDMIQLFNCDFKVILGFNSNIYIFKSNLLIVFIDEIIFLKFVAFHILVVFSGFWDSIKVDWLQSDISIRVLKIVSICISKFPYVGFYSSEVIEHKSLCTKC